MTVPKRTLCPDCGAWLVIETSWAEDSLFPGFDHGHGTRASTVRACAACGWAHVEIDYGPTPGAEP